MTPQQLHQASHGGLAGPVVDGDVMTATKARIDELERLASDLEQRGL